MNGERIDRAMARIEAASQRIEAAASRATLPNRDPELKQKYETLRKEAGTALAELDRLLGALEP